VPLSTTPSPTVRHPLWFESANTASKISGRENDQLASSVWPNRTSVRFGAVSVITLPFVSAEKLYGETFGNLKIITVKQRFSEKVSLKLIFSRTLSPKNYISSTKFGKITPVMGFFYEGYRELEFDLYFAQQHNLVVSSMSSPQI
jgi:hypothetical protein